MPNNKRKPKTPRPIIDVGEPHCERAIQRDSSHCAVADAIAEQVPNARNISVDLQTIRWSDPSVGLRYIYLTPRPAQEMLIAIDEGWDDLVKPIRFELRNAQVVPMKRRVTDTNGVRKQTPYGKTTLAKADRQGTGGSLIRTGGKPPPLAALANSPRKTLGKRRAFGLKSLRRPYGERSGQA